MRRTHLHFPQKNYFNMKDYYWLNEKSRKFLQRDYLKEGETPESRILDIANASERILGIEGFSDKFVSYMKKGWYSLSSPVWANFGQKRGLPISCNSSYVPDDMYEILNKATEVGMMSKMGAGTSGYFGDIRPRGSKISEQGEASGPVHFMEIFDTVSEVVSQSGVRRGSFAAYLPIEHPDIEEFLNIRSIGHSIQNMSIGITVTDKWIEEMKGGDSGKRALWAKVIQKRVETGYPYIVFIDTVNNNKPQVYKDKDIKILNSNLCVTGDTTLEIIADGDKKTVRIRDLGFYMDNFKEVKVLSKDGESVEYNTITDFAQTGESQEIIEIETENGKIVKCTPEHKIFTKNRGYVEAQFLKEEDILDIV